VSLPYALTKGPTLRRPAWMPSLVSDMPRQRAPTIGGEQHSYLQKNAVLASLTPLVIRSSVLRRLAKQRRRSEFTLMVADC
jgi:hypothetical protein